MKLLKGICYDIKSKKEIFNKHSEMHEFIDYYSSGQFATELQEFLNNEISDIVENGQ